MLFDAALPALNKRAPCPESRKLSRDENRSLVMKVDMKNAATRPGF